MESWTSVVPLSAEIQLARDTPLGDLVACGRDQPSCTAGAAQRIVRVKEHGGSFAAYLQIGLAGRHLSYGAPCSARQHFGSGSNVRPTSVEMRGSGEQVAAIDGGLHSQWPFVRLPKLH